MARSALRSRSSALFPPAGLMAIPMLAWTKTLRPDRANDGARLPRMRLAIEVLAVGDVAGVQHQALDVGVVQQVAGHRLHVSPRAVLVSHPALDPADRPWPFEDVGQGGGGRPDVIGVHDLVEAPWPGL